MTPQLQQEARPLPGNRPLQLQGQLHTATSWLSQAPHPPDSPGLWVPSPSVTVTTLVMSSTLQLTVGGRDP